MTLQACKHFHNEGECVSRCPTHQKYNPYTLEMEENPEGKFAYGALCVKDCPGKGCRITLFDLIKDVLYSYSSKTL